VRILAWRSAGAELSQGQKGSEKHECELASCLDMILSFYNRPSIRMGGIHCLTMDSLHGLPLRRDEPEASRRELPTGATSKPSYFRLRERQMAWMACIKAR
jgi:hypothetical protein